MDDQPGPPARPRETGEASLAPTLSRFAHLGARVADPAPTSAAPSTLPAAPPAAPAKRLPFWRRIALPKATPLRSLDEAARMESIAARLAELEDAFATHRSRTAGRLERAEDALHQIRERERANALARIDERLAGLEADRQRVETALTEAARGLRLAVIVFALSAAVGVAALLAWM